MDSASTSSGASPNHAESSAMKLRVAKRISLPTNMMMTMMKIHLHRKNARCLAPWWAPTVGVMILTMSTRGMNKAQSLATAQV